MIHGETLVDRVVFEGRRAVAVEARVSGTTERVAGERGDPPAPAPSTLPRSSCARVSGPGTQLRALGIEPRADLPVGENLVEHPLASLVIDLLPEARGR